LGCSMSRGLLCLAIVVFFCYESNAQVSVEVNYNVTQLITSRGYTCIEHTVTTEDGYLLSVQNIPGKGPPVYLQHGFVDTSATWVINSETESLGFILADAGFDVWLGNTRGNEYCLKNVNYSNTTQEFWNFSWDEIAAYDVPAKISYILEQTKQSQLSYIGHSEGTLIGFTEFSSNNATASQVNLFIALAPVVYLTNVGELIKLSAKLPPALIKDIFGTMSFLEPWSEISEEIASVCANDTLICETGLCAIAGCELGNMNSSMLPVYFSHYPAGSSIQNLLHYQQSVLNPVYQKYDYGTASANQQHYGQSTPPQYSLSTLYTPTALFSGSHDKFADPTDVQTLISQMPVDPYYQEEIRGYGHADFIWGKDAHRKLYPKVVSLLQVKKLTISIKQKLCKCPSECF